ncbi:methyltransferase [Actinotalea sp. BY-33]|uniref:Methyltransferase n=1 Tax=Actinotalea soli TaxID=2819234 RepID=A0A939RXA8_9CELL|nr:methyltransferase [Actinotalea soli]
MSSPPPVVHHELVDALRADLDSAGAGVAAIEERIGPVAAAALHREQALPALRATAGADDPVATLLRVFVLGGAVPRRAVDRALPTLGSDGAARLGLVRTAGAGPEDEVRALVDLRPVSATDAGGPVTWWLASDLGELATGGALRYDHVLGVGGASTTLAQVTVRDHRRRTLDLGTGCGIQALHAARHSDAVVATDISERALGFAAFNAALAGVELDLRQGSMLEPADGLFDLVVSNPPFVITPRGSGSAGRSPGEGARQPSGEPLPHYEYRDGGRSGDDLVRDLVREVGGVLAPGGVAQLLGNWEHRRGADWRERVGTWVDEAGLDAWVVQREVQDPAEYAETWLRDGGSTPDRDPAGWAAAYGAWLEDFASREVDAVGFGLVLLRRPVSGPPTLRRLEEWSGPVRQPLGTHLAACLEAHDTLVTLTDADLADRRLVVAPDVTEERHLTPGASDPTVVLLRQGDGFGRSVRAGTALAGLVGACDGELTLGQILGGVAALLDVPADALAAELLPEVRGLTRDGFLHVT